MSDAVTHRTLDDILRRLAHLEAVSRIPYASGTYLPTYLGATTAGATTYTLQVGGYLRLGRLILAAGIVVWTAASGTGNAIVSLPFTANPTAGAYQSGSLRLTGVTFANHTPQMLINPATAYFQMDSPLTNANPTTVAVEAAGNIVFTAVYFT